MSATGKAVRSEDPVVSVKGKAIGSVTICTRENGLQFGLALVTRQSVQEGKTFHGMTLPRTDSAKAESRSDERAIDSLRSPPAAPA